MAQHPFRHHQLPCDDVDLHVVRSGDGDRPVILLHGFPESWITWERQIHALAGAGFSVFAPDLRGYGDSSRPSSRSAYHLDRLVADVVALVKHTSAERASIVGHDWGGLIAWAFASRHPELVRRLVILNAPHPRIFGKRVRRPPQLLRSWYIIPARIPGLAEAILSAADFWLIRTMFRSMPATPHTFSEQKIDAFVAGLRQPGALTAALEYYRANGSFRGVRQIDVPTLVLWGEKDPALGVDLLEGLEQYVPDLQIRRFPRVGHWIQNEAPGEVNDALVEFLGPSTSF